ncbi:MAG: sensor histidine kinase, partial [Candidatus Limnocylindria bacterium]
LEEVLRALLENAAHYSDATAPIDVSAAPADGLIRISVADHGRGIPSAEQEMIFRSFHRVDAGDATTDGYGLGLYFADRLTRAQGGTITVESPLHVEPERPGSRFTISVPIASDEPEDAQGPAAPAPQRVDGEDAT